MTIRHLTVFKAVCEEKSITRAAKRLFMTQPAVSHVIADLEDRAGAPLKELWAEASILILPSPPGEKVSL